MLGGWKVEGVSELSDLILQSGAGARNYSAKGGYIISPAGRLSQLANL